jgi:hypothetical protein
VRKKDSYFTAKTKVRRKEPFFHYNELKRKSGVRRTLLRIMLFKKIPTTQF